MILSLTYKLLLSNMGVLAHSTGSDPHSGTINQI